MPLTLSPVGSTVQLECKTSIAGVFYLQAFPFVFASVLPPETSVFCHRSGRSQHNIGDAPTCVAHSSTVLISSVLVYSIVGILTLSFA